MINSSTNMDTEKQINPYQFHIQKRLNIFPKDNDAIKVVQLLSAVDQMSHVNVV